jgi:hypothetical protein
LDLKRLKLLLPPLPVELLLLQPQHPLLLLPLLVVLLLLEVLLLLVALLLLPLLQSN